MLTLRTIPKPARLAAFFGVVIADLATRLTAASLDAHHILLASETRLTNVEAFNIATGVAVPLMAAPLFLSPLAFVLGQIFVLTESRWVRYVSAVFIVASFIVYALSPAMSAFAALLAYMILASGMLQNSD